MWGALLYAFMIASALMLQVIIHELGHTLAARAFGDQNAKFRLLVIENGRFEGLGLAVVSKTFMPAQELVIDLGGVGFSWLVACLLWWVAPFLDAFPVPVLLFLLAFYLFLRLNFLLYTVRDALMNGLLRDRRLVGDITIFAERLASISSVSRWAVYLWCLLLGVLDAAFIGICVRHLAALWGGWAA